MSRRAPLPGQLHLWRREQGKPMETLELRPVFPRFGFSSPPNPIVPMPHDQFGQEYRSGPFAVYQCTDGDYIVRDARLPLGEQIIALSSSLLTIIEEFNRVLEEHNADATKAAKVSRDLSVATKGPS